MPVETVNWFDCDAAMRHQGLELPSELRWEYAYRAGTTTSWWTDDTEDSLKNKENVGRENLTLLPVGSLEPNKFGLFDMGGNLCEWCRDQRTNYGSEQNGDGLRPSRWQRSRDGASFRIIRGGYFGLDPVYAQSGTRNGISFTDRFGILGLRAARTSSQ